MKCRDTQFLTRSLHKGSRWRIAEASAVGRPKRGSGRRARQAQR
jgi:hypothetical protein